MTTQNTLLSGCKLIIVLFKIETETRNLFTKNLIWLWALGGRHVESNKFVFTIKNRPRFKFNQFLIDTFSKTR